MDILRNVTLLWTSDWCISLQWYWVKGNGMAGEVEI